MEGDCFVPVFSPHCGCGVPYVSPYDVRVWSTALSPTVSRSENFTVPEEEKGKLGVMVMPKKGRAVLWWNRDQDGGVAWRSRHGAACLFGCKSHARTHDGLAVPALQCSRLSSHPGRKMDGAARCRSSPRLPLPVAPFLVPCTV
jgi:hypothetical protein